MDMNLWDTCVDLARSLEDVGAMPVSDRVAVERLVIADGARPRGRGQARVAVVGKVVVVRPDGHVDTPVQG